MLFSFPFINFFLKGEILSVNKVPSKWSYSCWITLARIPEKVSWWCVKFSSWYFIVISDFLLICSRILGILKQPSSKEAFSPDSSIITGLIKVFLTDLTSKPEFCSKSSVSNGDVSKNYRINNVSIKNTECAFVCEDLPCITMI